MITTLWDRPAPSAQPLREDEDRPLIGARDARVRVLSGVMLVAAVLTLTDWRILAVFILAITLFARLTGITFREQHHRLVHVEGFMLALLVLLPLTVPGTPIANLGPFSLSAEGAARAGMIVLKVLATAQVIFALLGTLEPVRLGRALAHLGAPAKLVHLFLFAIRYVTVYRRETTRLRDAMRARAFKPSLTLHTLATYGNLLGMILVRSLERAERVDEAMRCRAFSGQFLLRAPKRVGRADMIFLGIGGAVAVGLVLLTISA